MTFHASSTGVFSGTAVTTATGTMPTATTNDILVSDLCAITPGTFTCPTSWTHVTTNSPGASNQLVNNMCFIKYTGTNPSLVFNWTTSSGYALRIRSFTGANTTTPNDGNGIETDNNNGATTTLVSGTATPSQAGDEVLVDQCYYTSGGTAAGAITGSPTVTNDFDDSAQNPATVGNHLDSAGSGVTGTYTYTFSGGASHVGQTIVFLLAPAGAAAPSQPGWVFSSLARHLDYVPVGYLP